MLHQLVSLHVNIIAHPNEVSDMLLGVALAIELVELGRLITMGACEEHQSSSCKALYTSGSCETLLPAES